jgi:molybdopterin/thiamine biosynthesis adenylyltransferase
MKTAHIRFNSVDWYGIPKEMTVGGAGTIGSWLTLLLARSGDHDIILYDDDTVSEENMAGQLYGRSHVGMPKVEAMKDILNGLVDMSGNIRLDIYGKRIQEGTYVSPVCFSCFDNMKARKDMFNNWMKRDDRELFIDGRMSIETYEVYTVRKGQEKEYMETLFDDSEIPDQICSLKATSHTGALIAGRMMSMFTNHLANSVSGMDIRSVPFSFREDMEYHMITTV